MILKKKNFLLCGAACLGVLAGLVYYWAGAGDLLAATTTGTATDIGQSTAGKQACYNSNVLNTGTEIIYEKMNCANCSCQGSGKELFKFFGTDADCDKRAAGDRAACNVSYPYGPGGTLAAAGNLVVGGGSLFLGELSRGAKLVLDKLNNLTLSVGFTPVMTLSANVAENYRLKITNGVEIQGNLKAERINFQGHDLKFITINGKNVLYYED